MKTRYTVTLQVELEHDRNHSFVDERSVKNAAIYTSKILEICQYGCYADNHSKQVAPNSVKAILVELKENGHKVDLTKFGK